MIKLKCDFCPNESELVVSDTKSEYVDLRVTLNHGYVQRTFHICPTCQVLLGFPKGRASQTSEERLIDALQELINKGMETACASNGS